MNRAKKKQALRAMNEKMRLNGQPMITMKEFNNMERFKTAYSLEEKRVKKAGLKKMLVIVFVIFSLIIGWKCGGYVWIVELINQIK